jgi:hypothetical protein
MPNVKTQPKRAEVDLTRVTPWGTHYRVVRAATIGVETAEGKPWVTLCLEHKTHHESSSLKTACLAGTKGSSARWCKQCLTASKAPKAAPVKKVVAETKPAPAAKRAAPAKKTPAPAAKPTTTTRKAPARRSPAKKVAVAA